MSVYSKKRADGSTAWYIDFYDSNGSRIRRVGGATKSEAKRALERARSDKYQGKYDLVVKTQDPLISEFVNIFLESSGSICINMRRPLCTNLRLDRISL